MDEVRLEQRLTTIEQGQKHMTDAIMAIQKTYTEFKDLALSVNTLAIEVKRVVDDVCGLRGVLKADLTELGKRVTTIEHKPGKRWENLVGTLISLLIGAVVGFIAGEIKKSTGG